jgi:hypothetical protein
LLEERERWIRRFNSREAERWIRRLGSREMDKGAW